MCIHSEFRTDAAILEVADDADKDSAVWLSLLVYLIHYVCVCGIHQSQKKRRTMMQTKRSFDAVLSLLLLLGRLGSMALVSASTATSVPPTNLEHSCRERGLDPTQLSCDTCGLLVSSSLSSLHTACLECCQSYKSLDSMTSRYGSAVLIHVPEMSEEVDAFVKEDFQKGGGGELDIRTGTLRVDTQKPNPPMYGDMMMMQQHRQRPSALYFFANDQPPTDPHEYASQSKELILLHGWSRDDLKDMINTLLPSK